MLFFTSLLTFYKLLKILSLHLHIYYQVEGRYIFMFATYFFRIIFL